MNSPFKVLSQHLHGVQGRTLSGTLGNTFIFSVEHFRGGFVFALQITVLLCNPNGLMT